MTRRGGGRRGRAGSSCRVWFGNINAVVVGRGVDDLMDILVQLYLTYITIHHLDFFLTQIYFSDKLCR